MALETVNGVSIGTATSAETGFGQYQETSKFFCANGKAITITAREDGESGCTVTWEDNGNTYSQDLTYDYYICGGSFDSAVESANITMNGGNVLTVFGGGVCAGATVEGNVTIALAGGYLDKFVGGGICGAVEGNINITMAEDTEIRENFIGGGFMEGADVANVNIEINGGSIDNGSSYAIMTGGGVSSDVKGKVSITINGGDINAVVAAGSMLTGSVAETEIEVNGGTVLSLAGGNCDYYGYGDQEGTVGNVAITVKGGTICDAIQGGSVYNSPVTGDVTIDVLGGTIGTMGEADVIIAEYIGGTATVNISSAAAVNGGIKGADVFTVDEAVADFSTIYVDPNYHNCDFETGKIAGINVFAKFTDALQVASQESTVSTVKIESSIAEEIMPTDVELLVNNDLLITADSAVTVNLKNNGTSYDIVLGAQTEGKTITFGKNVTLTLDDRLIWAGYYGNNFDVVIEGTVSAYQWWNGTDTEIKAGGKLITSGEAMVFRRGATVTIIGDAAQGAAEADRTVQLDANYLNFLSGNLMASDALIESGAVWVANTGSYCNESTVWISLDNTILNSTGNLKLISDQTALMEVENGSVLNITNHDGYAASEIGSNGFLWIYDSTASFADLNNNGDIDIANSTFTVNGTLKNTGAFAAADSTVCATTITNAGSSMTFTDVDLDVTNFSTGTGNGDAYPVIGGVSKVQIDNLNGFYALRLADGTTLKGGSSIDGPLSVRSLGDLTIGESADDVVFITSYDNNGINWSEGQTLTVNGTLNVSVDGKGWQLYWFGINGGKFGTDGVTTLTGSGTVNSNTTAVFQNGTIVIDENMKVNVTNVKNAHLRFSEADVTIKGSVDKKGYNDTLTILRNATVTVEGSLTTSDQLHIGYDTYDFATKNNYKSTLNATEGAKIEAVGSANINLDSTLNIAGAAFTSAGLVNHGTVNISGASDIKTGTVSGNGWINMDTVTLDEDTNIQGGKVRFTNGESTLDGAVINGSAFQVGLGGYMLKDERETVADVVVNVKNDSYINAADVDYYGWIGSGFFDTDAQKAEAMTDARYILNVNNSIAHYGYLHISNDGILNVTGNATEKESYAGVSYSFWGGRFIINGVATFDNVDVAAQFTNISCNNGTDNAGKLVIKNGATYVSWRDGSTADTSFQINNKGSVEVDGATMDLRHGTTIAANAALTVKNNGIFKGNAVTNAGTIALDATVSFSANTLTSTGTITIDAADFVGTKKIIDLSGTESLEGKVTVENLAEGTQVFFYEDGDVVLSSAAIDTLFVNAAYAGNTGDSTEDGKFIGVNAFADITSAIKAAEAQGGAIIDMTDVEYSGKQQGETAKNGLFQTNGTYTFTNGDYADFVYVDSPRPTEENAGLVDVNIVFDNAKMVANKFRLDNGASLTIKDSHIDCNDVTSRGWTTYYGDSTIDITNSVVGWDIYDQGKNSDGIIAGDKETVYAASNAGAGAMTWQGSGVMTVENSTIFAFTDEGAYAASYAVYDRGLISFKNSAVYGKTVKVGLAYSDKTAGRDGEIATMVFDNSVLRDLNGDGATQIVVGDGSDTAGKLIVTNSVIDYAGAIMTINANGIAEFSGSKITVNSVSNKGELVFNFANIDTIDADGLLLIDAAKASDYGTVTLNGLDAKYEAVTIGEDLYAFDMSTVYVDAAYSTYAAGAKIADGIFMGINAFASLEDLNTSVYSAGDRTVVYTYAGSVAGQKITVANDPDTTGVQYSFNGTGVSFSNGSRTHTITEAGVYTFDFAKGDYNFAIEEFVGNTTVALPDAANVAVNQIVGDQEFTFSVADNTTGTFACSFSGVSGAFRVTIYRGTEEVASKLFNAAGSYSVDDLAAGEYSVVFSAYGNNSAGAQLTADFELTSVAAPVAGDPCSTLDNTSAGSIGADFAAGMTLENWVGTEDKIDWFQIEDVTAGTHSFNFELEGNNLAVVIYDANLKTLSSFTVTDKVADGVDFTRSLKLAADSDLFIKVTGRGADSDYSISIA